MLSAAASCTKVIKLPNSFSDADRRKVLQWLRDCVFVDDDRGEKKFAQRIAWDYLDLHQCVFFFEKVPSSTAECYRNYVVNGTDLWCEGALHLAIHERPASSSSLATFQRLVAWLLARVDTALYGVLLERPSFHALLLRMVALWGGPAADWIADAINAHLGWTTTTTTTSTALSSSSSSSATEQMEEERERQRHKLQFQECPCCCGGKVAFGEEEKAAPPPRPPSFRSRLCRSGRFVRTLFLASQPCHPPPQNGRPPRRPSGGHDPLMLLHAVLSRWSAPPTHSACAAVVEQALVPLLHLGQDQNQDLLARISSSAHADHHRRPCAAPIAPIAPICGVCDKD